MTHDGFARGTQFVKHRSHLTPSGGAPQESRQGILLSTHLRLISPSTFCSRDSCGVSRFCADGRAYEARLEQ